MVSVVPMLHVVWLSVCVCVFACVSGFGWCTFLVNVGVAQYGVHTIQYRYVLGPYCYIMCK